MPTANATVIATFSRRMRLRLDDGEIIEAKIKGKKLRPVCGDKVSATPIAGETDWLIDAIDERDNELTRPNLRGSAEVLAANIELLAVAAAATPKPDWFIVDRYLAAAENMGADGLVIFNKSDLAEAPQDLLGVYENLGYPTIVCSATDQTNVEPIEHAMRERTAILVGQSGVGKSSLINALVPEEQLKTGDISDKTREGRHTTVNSVMIDLPNGGHVIDSPGVRDYAPALRSTDEVITGFREIREAGNHCRFANCRHMQEPGCAVKAGVEDGAIDARRYESYRRALILTEKLTRDRY